MIQIRQYPHPRTSVMDRCRRRSTDRTVTAAPGGACGFTVLELLVAMGVISLLLALLVPAVMQVRERARSAHCANNLRQMISACHAFEATNGEYPAYLGPGDRQTGFVISNLSGHAELLPFLDQLALHDTLIEEYEAPGDPPRSQNNQQAMEATIPVFVCPSDDVPTGGNTYRASVGTCRSGLGCIHGPSRTPDPGLRGVFNGFGTRPAKITDGLSQTAFYSERLVGDRNHDVFTPWRDIFRVPGIVFSHLPDEWMLECLQPVTANVEHVSFSGSTWLFTGLRQTQYNHILTPNSGIPDCHTGVGVSTARSFHPGGVNLALGDGAVRFAADTIDLGVWRALASKSGKEVASASF